MILFIHFWWCWVFIALHRPSLAGGEQAAGCDGFSCCGAQAVGQAGFCGCSLQAPEHGLSSCGSRALLLFGMWAFPRPRDHSCLLPWLVNSYPLCHQESPSHMFWCTFISSILLVMCLLNLETCIPQWIIMTIVFFFWWFINLLHSLHLIRC